MTTPATTIDVTPTGDLVIDGEHLLPPPGIDHHTAITRHLQLQAADTGTTIHATIHDQPAGRTLHLDVDPDGTTRHATPNPPLPAVPAAYRPDLDALLTSARSDQLPTAVTEAEQLLAKISDSCGPDHPATLVVAQIRSDLAWLTGDLPYAMTAWLWIADAWTRHLPLGTRAIGVAARNAAAVWHHLPDDQAQQAGPELLDLLNRVAPHPNANPTIQGIHHRLALLTQP